MQELKQQHHCQVTAQQTGEMLGRRKGCTEEPCMPPSPRGCTAGETGRQGGAGSNQSTPTHRRDLPVFGSMTRITSITPEKDPRSSHQLSQALQYAETRSPASPTPTSKLAALQEEICPSEKAASAQQNSLSEGFVCCKRQTQKATLITCSVLN